MENCHQLRRSRYSTLREPRLIEFKFGERVARAARSRRFHCCRCNLILEFRNKKRLPSCATDVTSISRSSFLPSEYSPRTLSPDRVADLSQELAPLNPCDDAFQLSQNNVCSLSHHRLTRRLNDPAPTGVSQCGSRQHRRS